MARSINMAVVLGNLTRAPELRYTPAGHAVCSFGVATNRMWKTAEGDRREDAEFHNVVAWNRLAEICSQYLTKGQKVYIQGRLQTRTWEGKDGARRSRTEIVADDMVMLQRPGGAPPSSEPGNYNNRAGARQAPRPSKVNASEEVKKEIKEGIKEGIKKEALEKSAESESKSASSADKSAKNEDVDPKKMPF